MKTILLFGLIWGAVLWADAPKTVPGKFHPLRVGGETLTTVTSSLSVLLHALERGHPLVSRMAKPEEAPAPAPAQTTFAGVSAAQQNLIQGLKQASQADREAALLETGALRTWKERALAGLVVDPVPAGTPTFPDDSIPVLPFGRSSLAPFLQCVVRTLPLLKAQRIAQHRGDVKSALALDVALMGERGDGEVVSSEGLACGKYLGELGFWLVDGAEQIKWLTALARAIQNQNLEAWKYFWLFGKAFRGEEVQAPHFWVYAWKRAAFSLVFQQGKIPDRELLITQYLAAYRWKPGHRGFTVTHAQNLRRSLKADWQQVEDRDLFRE